MQSLRRGLSATSIRPAADQYVRNHRNHRTRYLPPTHQDDLDAGSVIGIPIPDLQMYILVHWLNGTDWRSGECTLAVPV
jgi:hypothetical protein